MISESELEPGARSQTASTSHQDRLAAHNAKPDISLVKKALPPHIKAAEDAMNAFEVRYNAQVVGASDGTRWHMGNIRMSFKELARLAANSVSWNVQSDVDALRGTYIESMGALKAIAGQQQLAKKKHAGDAAASQQPAAEDKPGFVEQEPFFAQNPRKELSYAGNFFDTLWSDLEGTANATHAKEGGKTSPADQSAVDKYAGRAGGGIKVIGC